MKEIVRRYALATGIPVDIIKITKSHVSEEGTIRETVHYHATGPVAQLPTGQLPIIKLGVGEFDILNEEWHDFFSDAQLEELESQIKANCKTNIV